VDSSYPYLKTVDRIPGYVMYEVSSHDQMVKCGKNTKWCVTGSVMFKHYGPPYYLITKENGERFALIHVGSTQIKDEYDAALSVEDMMKIKPFLEKLFSNNREKGTHSSLQSRLFDRSRNKDQKNLMDVISAKEGLPDFTVSSFNRIKYSPDVMEKIEKVFSANVIRNDAMTSRNTLFIDTDLTADFAGLDNYQPTITLRMYYKAMESSIRMKLSKEPQNCMYLSKSHYEDHYYYGYFPKERIMKGFARLKKNLEEHIAKEEAANQV